MICCVCGAAAVTAVALGAVCAFHRGDYEPRASRATVMVNLPVRTADSA